jgi:hypothetical protein
MATAVHARTLKQLQYTIPLNSESLNYTSYVDVITVSDVCNDIYAIMFGVAELRYDSSLLQKSWVQFLSSYHTKQFTLIFFC